jgi:hypothetical protein
MPLVLAVVSKVYALTCFGSALCSGSKWKLVLPLAAMYVITHVSYGVGYLVALPLALMRRMQKESNRQ